MAMVISNLAILPHIQPGYRLPEAWFTKELRELITCRDDVLSNPEVGSSRYKTVGRAANSNPGRFFFRSPLQKERMIIIEHQYLTLFTTMQHPTCIRHSIETSGSLLLTSLEIVLKYCIPDSQSFLKTFLAFKKKNRVVRTNGKSERSESLKKCQNAQAKLAEKGGAPMLTRFLCPPLIPRSSEFQQEPIGSSSLSQG